MHNSQKQLHNSQKQRTSVSVCCCTEDEEATPDLTLSIDDSSCDYRPPKHTHTRAHALTSAAAPVVWCGRGRAPRTVLTD